MCILNTERKIKHLLLNEIRMYSFAGSIYNNCGLRPFLLFIAENYSCPHLWPEPGKNITPDFLNPLAKIFPADWSYDKILLM